jgi:hypothetical protein
VIHRDVGAKAEPTVWNLFVMAGLRPGHPRLFFLCVVEDLNAARQTRARRTPNFIAQISRRRARLGARAFASMDKSRGAATKAGPAANGLRIGTSMPPVNDGFTLQRRTRAFFRVFSAGFGTCPNLLNTVEEQVAAMFLVEWHRIVVAEPGSFDPGSDQNPAI